MSTLVFSDNTVLVNFGLLKRPDVLLRIMNGRGAWCATVASECLRSSAEPGLETLVNFTDNMGTPWFPESPVEHIQVRLFRDELASPGDGPHSHLGEAETIAIIIARGINAAFVTDDLDARRLADANKIQTYSTWEMLKLAGRVKILDADTVWGYLQTLQGLHRGHPPGVVNRHTFEAWLAAPA